MINLENTSCIQISGSRLWKNAPYRKKLSLDRFWIRNVAADRLVILQSMVDFHRQIKHGIFLIKLLKPVLFISRTILKYLYANPSTLSMAIPVLNVANLYMTHIQESLDSLLLFQLGVKRESRNFRL